MQRTLYEDYLGVRPDIPASRIDITPMLPKNLRQIVATVPAGSGNWLRVSHALGADGGTVTRVEPSAIRLSSTRRAPLNGLHAVADRS